MEQSLSDLLRSEQTRLKSMNDQLRARFELGALVGGPTATDVAASMTEDLILRTTRSTTYTGYLDMLRRSVAAGETPEANLKALRKAITVDLANQAMLQDRQSASAAKNAQAQAELSAIAMALQIFLRNFDD